MEKFIAKFGDRTQGVLSGLDRVLFRGSLRRLTHSQGMKWYLAENNILCKQYQDHVKEISQELKKGNPEAVATAERCSSTRVRQRRQRGTCESHRSRTGHRAGRRLRVYCTGDGPHVPTRENRYGGQEPAVPHHLLVSYRSTTRLDARPSSDLFPLLHARLHQRAGVVEPPHGSATAALCASEELFSMDRRCAAGAAAV